MRDAYRVGRRKWKIPNISASFVDQVAQSLFLSALLHGAWCLVCWPIRLGLGLTVDLRSLAMLLIGNYGKDSERLEPVLNSLTAPYHPTAILVYLLSLNGIAYLLGAWAHEQVRSRGWDYSIDWLRFDNPWFYLFYPHPAGAILQDEKGVKKELNSTRIAAVVNHNDGDVIYRGLLKDYTFGPDGSLHSVHLEEAERRPLPPANSQEEFHAIEGDILILCYSEIKTFNIQYRYQDIEPETSR